MTLTDFLLARIAEEEDVARAAIEDFSWQQEQDFGGFTVKVYDHIARHDPARVLAECEAKRRIVEMEWHHLGDDDYAWGMEEAKRQILAVLALPYADHSDYDEEWRP